MPLTLSQPVHDEQRGAARHQRDRALEGLAAVHPPDARRRTPYQGATEKALGMWRMALTAPSSLKMTATTSKRHGVCRMRFSLR